MCATFAAVVNVGVFGVLGGFLTYSLVQMIGSVRMVQSSVGAHMTPRVVTALAGVPVAYVVTVCLAHRWTAGPPRGQAGRALLVATALVWVVGGHLAYGSHWATRQDRRIAQNAHWVFVSSWWQRDARRDVHLSDRFADADLADFEPIGVRVSAPRADVRRAAVRTRTKTTPLLPRRPPNVVLIVLESVAARWTSLYGGRATRPRRHCARKRRAASSSTISTRTSGAAPIRCPRCCCRRTQSWGSGT